MVFAEEEVPLSKLKHGWYTFFNTKSAQWLYNTALVYTVKFRK